MSVPTSAWHRILAASKRRTDWTSSICGCRRHPVTRWIRSFCAASILLTRRLEEHRGINAVDGPTTVLRWARYIESGSDQLPTAPTEWPKLAADLEQILLTQPGARSYVDMTNVSSVRLSIRGRGELFGPPGAMRNFILQTWNEAQASDPNLRSVHGELAGKGVLSGNITERLLPTLTQSFAITASAIFLAFLVVFRSPSARLMTMIPSFFAILSVFIVMRVASIPLNIATILIGSTVLGATENDQVHFFYHLQEGRSSGTTSGALKHAMLTAGRPILFATLINTSGFLALTLSGSAAHASVRDRVRIGLHLGIDCRLYGTPRCAVDLEPRGAAQIVGLLTVLCAAYFMGTPQRASTLRKSRIGGNTSLFQSAPWAS